VLYDVGVARPVNTRIGSSRAVEGGDHRSKPRRRGERLLGAVFAATLEELAEVGFTDLTMEGIAARAHTGKATLYRRWPGRAALVLDALSHALPPGDPLPDTATLREALLLRLRQMADAMAGPVGAAARGLLAEVVRDPELAQAVRDRIIEPALERMREPFERAAERGEIPDQAFSPLVVSVGPTLLRHHFLLHGAPIPDSVLAAIVDEVVLPLVGATPAASTAETRPTTGGSTSPRRAARRVVPVRPESGRRER
jgi:AcrR family transcriptional regulator